METFIKEVSVQEGWAFSPATCRFLGEALRGLWCVIGTVHLDVSFELSCRFLPVMSVVFHGISPLNHHVRYILAEPWNLRPPGSEAIAIQGACRCPCWCGLTRPLPVTNPGEGVCFQFADGPFRISTGIRKRNREMV